MDEQASYTAWCQQLFSMMAPGGIWGVPRSGIVFRKDSEDPPLLRVVEMPDGSEDDFEAIREQFGLAGIAVERKEEDES